jgi:hypothetical protein
MEQTIIWSIRMKTYLQALGYDVWKSVVTGYRPSKTPPTNATERRHVKTIQWP